MSIRSSFGLEYELIFKHNNKVYKVVRGKSKSFTINFLKTIQLQFTDSVSSITDINDNSQPFEGYALFNLSNFTGVASREFYFHPSDNTTKHPIMIGSSNSPVSVSQTKLVNPYDVVLSNIVFSSGNISSVTTSGNEASFTIARSFTNNDTIAKDIGEFGLVCRYLKREGAVNDPPIADYYVLISRDILSPIVSLIPSATLTITYKMRTIA